jgi:hypothetical protein
VHWQNERGWPLLRDRNQEDNLVNLSLKGGRMCSRILRPLRREEMTGMSSLKLKE